MKKEIILAIVIGLLFGLLITYGIYRARRALTTPPANPSPTPISDIAETNANNNKLIIINPIDESVQSATSLTVAGTTTPGSFVIIFINDAESITTADAQGNFSAERVLENGSNIITVTATDEDGLTTTQERTVIVVTSPAVENSTQSATTSTKTTN